MRRRKKRKKKRRRGEEGREEEQRLQDCSILFSRLQPPKTKPVRETLGYLACVFLNRIRWWSV